jgi:hypothetical protein
MDWQNYTIIGIVTIAFVVLLVRIARPKRGSKGCDHGCGCDKSRHPK